MGARSELVVIPGADHGSAEFDQAPLHERTLEFLASLARREHARR
jgi:hypothetical protein